MTTRARDSDLDDETIASAARWLADQREPLQPIIPELMKRFGLTSLEAQHACRKAERMCMLRAAHG